MLRQRISKYGIRTTPAERALLIKSGQAVGPGLHKLITIVAPSTYTGWIRNLKKQPSKKRTGRPRTPEASLPGPCAAKLANGVR